MAAYEITQHTQSRAVATLEDRIRELCSNVTAAPKTELHTAIAKLEAALREYTLRIENKAIKDLLYGLGKPDRRER